LNIVNIIHAVIAAMTANASGLPINGVLNLLKTEIIYALEDSTMAIVVGVLALQGAFKEHLDVLENLASQTDVALSAKQVRNTMDMDGLDGLILPGGESTVMDRLMHTGGLHSSIKEWIQSDRPTFGTCAGLILMADHITGKDEPFLGGLGITVLRNAYGRQQESFTTNDVGVKGEDRCVGVFIRAPAIGAVDTADIVATHNGAVVGVQHGNLLGLAFHPELADDLRWHKKFIKMIQEFKRQ
jgi:5'-phosphate synthase pdxT subunit